MIYICREHQKEVVVIANEVKDLPCPVCQEMVIGEDITFGQAQKTLYELSKTMASSESH